MSLDTLLEAARYLELQELKEQQQRQALAPLVRTHPQPAPLPPQTQPTAIIKPKQGQLCFPHSFCKRLQQNIIGSLHYLH